jgi:hypothetical protein
MNQGELDQASPDVKQNHLVSMFVLYGHVTAKH